MTRSLVLLTSLVAVVTGCAAPVHTMLRDDRTGQIVNCTAITTHPNVLTWIHNERQCSAGYQAMGYTCLQGKCR